MSSLFVLMALAPALIISIEASWIRIVVQMVESWITAIGLLMLGWFVRGQSWQSPAA